MTRNLIAIPQTMLLLLMLCAVGLAVAVNMPNPVVTPMDPAHVDKHAEASSVINCNNIDSIWIDNKCVRFKYVKDVDGKCALEIVEPTKAGIRVVTAFLFDRGTREDLTNILKAQGCTKIYP